ncbi:hypothetical protein GLOIN_2v1481009 [Rhizophagus irregularis DAOM 181602=DAOM 197198]|nr:hypothetical protein GLOIN_2v1481009 [Rhizophagus irregularis DAOM 181602=DAOM 197198]
MTEKELYNKTCVVENIKHVAEASKESVDMKDPYIFSNNLATILARNKEVVAVRLKISDCCVRYLSRFGVCRDKYPKVLLHMGGCVSLNPTFLRMVLDEDRDLTRNSDEEYVKSFIEYALASLEEFGPKKLDDVNKSKISAICCTYCKQVEKSSTIPENFRTSQKGGILRCVNDKYGSMGK